MQWRASSPPNCQTPCVNSSSLTIALAPAAPSARAVAQATPDGYTPARTYRDNLDQSESLCSCRL